MCLVRQITPVNSVSLRIRFSRLAQGSIARLTPEEQIKKKTTLVCLLLNCPYYLSDELSAPFLHKYSTTVLLSIFLTLFSFVIGILSISPLSLRQAWSNFQRCFCSELSLSLPSVNPSSANYLKLYKSPNSGL